MGRSVKVAFGVGSVVALVGLGGLVAPASAGFNQEPSCENDEFTTPSGVAVVDGVADLCTDPDEDTLTYFVVPGSGPDNGTLDFDEVTGDFTYTPNPGFAGTDDFTFGAEDGFVVPQGADAVAPAEASFPAAITINVAAQVTTSLAPTTTAAPSTTAAVSPTSVLARTGSTNAAIAGSGFLTLGVGLGLVAASGALVARARQRS